MRFKRLMIVFAVVAALVGGGFGLYRWWYPYGYTHSCSHCLMIALSGYADEHEGRFPAGETTPEACLSLLYPKHADASVLRGKPSRSKQSSRSWLAENRSAPTHAVGTTSKG